MAVITNKRQGVKFEINAMEAESVFLVGDFNSWDVKKHPMKKDSDGIWRKKVMLRPGTYEYKFLVDGQWENDPKNEKHSINNYGTRNNWIRIG
jgi:1,4-alpha-glucan branching enzyme